MSEKKTIKILITGSVFDGKKFLEGVNELPLVEAISLVESGHAELVPDLQLAQGDSPGGSQPENGKTDSDGEGDNKVFDPVKQEESETNFPESEIEKDPEPEFIPEKESEPEAVKAKPGKKK